MNVAVEMLTVLDGAKSSAGSSVEPDLTAIAPVAPPVENVYADGAANAEPVVAASKDEIVTDAAQAANANQGIIRPE